MARESRNIRFGKEASEFSDAVVEIKRVTRVQAGGKRMRFRALVVVGDKKGRVGAGLKKGQDVAAAVAKATQHAKKNLVAVTIINGTIPHEMKQKFKAALVLLKPAKSGTGLIAGRSIRPVFELAGYTDIVVKMLGSGNKTVNVMAAIQALQKFNIN